MEGFKHFNEIVIDWFDNNVVEAIPSKIPFMLITFSIFY